VKYWTTILADVIADDPVEAAELAVRFVRTKAQIRIQIADEYHKPLGAVVVGPDGQAEKIAARS
jgi:hypothetical protein